MSLDSKDAPVALVTGAGRGLGRGIAIELAKNGLSIAIHYGSSKEGANETASLCQEAAINNNQLFKLIQADLADSNSRDTIIEQLANRFGHIDALINNAGITEPNRRDCLEATEEDYDTVMTVNLKAPYFLSPSKSIHF